MSLLFSIVMVAGFVIGVLSFLEQMSPEGSPQEARRWVRNWVVKGIVYPIALWMFLNLGLFSRMPSLMPDLDTVRGLSWWHLYSVISALGVFIIGTYWVGLTFVWFLGTLAKNTEKRREFNSTFLIASIFLGPLAGVIIKTCGWSFAGLATAAWAAPIAWLTLVQSKVEKIKPAYRRAKINLQFDRFEEAEAEVLKELETCEDDFEGWMILAELYANHFNDLAGADRIVRETSELPDAPVPEIAAAFNHLADWHLKVGEDPESARRALDTIVQRFPGTHLARMAQLRVDRLPKNRRELLEQRQVKKIRLPALGRPLDETVSIEQTDDAAEAAQSANRCVERLKDNPDNIAAREEFARILAERLGKVAAGLDQLELLLDLPEQPDTKRAEWMGQMAAWHLRYQVDTLEGKRLLQRLMRDFPEMPQAFAARRRLMLLEVEERMRGQRPKNPETPLKNPFIGVS